MDALHGYISEIMNELGNTGTYGGHGYFKYVECPVRYVGYEFMIIYDNDEFSMLHWVNILTDGNTIYVKIDVLADSNKFVDSWDRWFTWNIADPDFDPDDIIVGLLMLGLIKGTPR